MGDTEDKKKVHLVRWRKVCKPKKFGGLGIRMCDKNDQATLTKLGWRIINETDSL